MMANSQAKMVVLALTANSPKTHVSPNIGSSTTTARNSVLGKRRPQAKQCVILDLDNFSCQCREFNFSEVRIVQLSRDPTLQYETYGILEVPIARINTSHLNRAKSILLLSSSQSSFFLKFFFIVLLLLALILVLYTFTRATTRNTRFT